jgi:hypothetical protein
MSQSSDLERFARILELAKAAVLQLKPELAMEYLQEIKSELEAFRDNPIWIAKLR